MELSLICAPDLFLKTCFCSFFGFKPTTLPPEYCLETTQQLEDKIKEKAQEAYAEKIGFTNEMELFSNTITSCLHHLVATLDVFCEPALNAMLKVNW